MGGSDCGQHGLTHGLHNRELVALLCGMVALKRAFGAKTWEAEH